MLEYSIGSSNNRDDLYAEMLYENKQWGEIVLLKDRKSVRLIIYPRTDNKPLDFPYDEVMELIETAKTRLLAIEGIAPEPDGK